VKPIKDLAELNLPQINQKELLRFNRLLEDMRILTAKQGMIPTYFDHMDTLELIAPESPISKIPTHELKAALAQRLFDKIKHGDDQHQEWLRVTLEEFFSTKIECITPEPEIKACEHEWFLRSCKKCGESYSGSRKGEYKGQRIIVFDFLQFSELSEHNGADATRKYILHLERRIDDLENPEPLVKFDYGEIEKRVMASHDPQKNYQVAVDKFFDNALIGTDGSGDCDSFKDPDFDPKKWLGEA